MKIKIYASVSLTAAQIHEVLPDAEVAPPIKRDDMHRDLQAGVQVVGIVDGDFLQNLAVSPTEIIDAMRVGVLVFGAGSVGAVRAAELDCFGMVGCGRIYEHIKERPYFRDDYLGLVDVERSDSQRALSMIDFEATVARLVAEGQLAARVGHQLISRFRTLHFSLRTLDHLLDDVSTRRHAGALLDACALVRDHHVSQKMLDGLTMLACIRDQLQRVAHRNRMLNA